jgi:bis(5'-nucleosyl)-tetraphosphatase (symmetrical)
VATYAIGDIQGCLDPLKALLKNVDFTIDKDRLWIAGDLVNRGPKSLATLRFLYDLRDHIDIVLGNHDLHLLAVAAGFKNPLSSDTLDEILIAPDCNQLLNWLRAQPLMHHDPVLDYTMVHAGIPPQWTLHEALAYAKEVETILKGNDINLFLKVMYGNEPNHWSNSLTGMERIRLITNYFTRMRFCTNSGQLELKTKSTVEDAPEGYLPWFAIKNRKTKDDNIIFGHWAALKGEVHQKNIFALDTGCVWGGELTAMRLEDKKIFTVKNTLNK